MVGRTDPFKTGVGGLDKLIPIGIPRGSSVLVEGGPGCGKTLLCLQMAMNACKRGEKVLFMSFEEPDAKLREHMREFGWDVDALEKDGFFRIKRFNALDIARSVEALLSGAKRELLIDVHPMLFPKDFRPDVVFIDSLTSISTAFSGEESRFRIYMEQLFRYLETENITSFLINEAPRPAHTGGNYSEKGEAVSFLSDGIIVLYNVLYGDGRRGRAIEVFKMRGQYIEREIVLMEIRPKEGIVVYPKDYPVGNHTFL